MSKLPNDVVLVFAHLDDEVLWASSMLMQATKVITCFLDSYDDTELSSNRRKAIKSYPIDNFINLGVKETGVFKSSDWRNPVDTEHGILCAKNYQDYAKAFDFIKSKLLSLLSKGQTIITHNPWGEYGHEEHVLVYKVIQDISSELNLNVLVSGCVSNRSLYLMNNHTGELGDKYFLREPDYEVSAELKKFYQSHNCWTMPDDYQWPTFEIFYEIVNYSNVGSEPHMRPTVPMNIIVFKGAEISYKDIARFLYRKIFNNLRR
jgi:LmbE family N-acetylglucosaminyl deacetylase